LILLSAHHFALGQLVYGVGVSHVAKKPESSITYEKLESCCLKTPRKWQGKTSSTTSDASISFSVLLPQEASLHYRRDIVRGAYSGSLLKLQTFQLGGINRTLWIPTDGSVSYDLGLSQVWLEKSVFKVTEETTLNFRAGFNLTELYASARSGSKQDSMSRIDGAPLIGALVNNRINEHLQLNAEINFFTFEKNNGRLLVSDKVIGGTYSFNKNIDLMAGYRIQTFDISRSPSNINIGYSMKSDGFFLKMIITP
jgi:hypothetical protein